MSQKNQFRKKIGETVFIRTISRPWKIILPILPGPKTGISSTLIIIYSFIFIIAIGTVLLMLPISTKSGDVPGLIDALFTATSALCVTGLTVVNTAGYWSTFGQIVIVILIQLGGFGLMTTATLFVISFGHRIGFKEKMLIGNSLGVEKLGGIIGIVKQMAVFTFSAELIGAVFLYFRFTSYYHDDSAVWNSIFHSISAFNNAGFDLFGNTSLTIFSGDPYILFTIGALVVLGGISYLVVADFVRSIHPLRLSLDSKLIVFSTLILLIVGTLVILLTEISNRETLGAMSFPEQVLNAIFLSITTRTAGFYTIDVANVANYTLFFIMLLMFIGGASGSTAGGIKVTTIGILMATIWSTIRGRKHPAIFNRELTTEQIQKALSIVFVSLGFLIVIIFLLTITENFRFIELLFEAFSAFGTVGLSTGVTSNLSLAGKGIIIVTMFAGRLLSLILILTLTQYQQTVECRFPNEPIRIG
jgi:trk system potassium uptake protein